MTIVNNYSQIGFTCFTQDMKVLRVAVRQQFAMWNLRVFEIEADVDLAEIYADSPRPGGRHPAKALFFSPRIAPHMTVMFANYADGWQSLAVCVSRLISGRAYCFALGSDKEEWPKYSFEVIESGKERRHVSVIKDVDRWKFWHTGEVLPEENPVVYRKRRIRDRLTRGYLVSLAEQLGFPVGDERFWHSDSMAVYFEEQRSSPSECAR